MHSQQPKPLHRLCGRAMVSHVLGSLAALDVDDVVVVVGHGAELVAKEVGQHAPAGLVVTFARQQVQRGTGDAVATAMEALGPGGDDDEVIVVPADTPLLRAETLASLLDAHRALGAGATLLTAELADPTGYGRVVRGKDGRVAAIVEHGDATEEQRAIGEVNTSIYCFRRSLLAPALRRLSPTNAQGELYLTDVVSVLYDAGYPTHSLRADDPTEVAGVNDRVQLAIAEAELRRRINEEWMRRGVTMRDPACTFVDADVRLARDVTLLPGTVLEGRTQVGERAEVGPNALLEDCEVGADTTVGVVVARRARIGSDARVGDFCVLGPGAEVASGEVLGPHSIVDS
jgi:bifunctional UDP-N-acetylglucosamine pyrophosphorylase / glucosamine-1-phosphate N-acetyltransferase